MVSPAIWMRLATIISRAVTERIARHIRAWVALEDPESVHVEASQHAEPGRTRPIVIATSTKRRAFLHALGRTLKARGCAWTGAMSTGLPSVSGTGNVLIASVYLYGANGRSLPAQADAA